MHFAPARAHRRPPAIVLLGIATLSLALPAMAHDTNKSIRINPGNQVGAQSTVNGSITIGSGAVVDGSVKTVNGRITAESSATLGNAETVNGSIRLENGTQARNLESVNGSIYVEDSVTVDGRINVVNGKIQAMPGSSIAGDASNVNGEIRLVGAQVGGNLSTVNGDVLLSGNSIVRGDLVVEKPRGWGWGKQRKPRIVVGPGSRIDGEIRLEREVELYISDSASVGGVTGEMSLDDAVRFSGQRP